MVCLCFECRDGCTFYFFFFSSRRRHTRFDCDWSSDVCSSDLLRINLIQVLKNEIPVPPGHDLKLQVSSRWPRRINGWAAYNLLRIAQQAAANGWRHGRAHRIDVILDVDASNQAVVVVLDDGAGIDDSPHGFGMIGMRERAVILGGSFGVQSRESGGTRVEIHVPLDRIR